MVNELEIMFSLERQLREDMIAVITYLKNCFIDERTDLHCLPRGQEQNQRLKLQ